MARGVRSAGEIMRGARRRAEGLAKRRKPSFAELAAELFRIHQVAPHRFSDLAKEVGLSPRTGFYFVKIWEQIRHHPERKRLSDLGWTRLRLLVPHLDKATAPKLLDFAEKHTAQELQQHLKKQPLKNTTRCMLFRFSDEEHAVFAEALIRHGAKPRGRGLVGAEAALMKIVRKSL